MMACLRFPHGEVRQLQLGSSTSLGRADLNPASDFVSRHQATVSVNEHGGIEVVSSGSNPTGVRRDGSAAWSWLAKGERTALGPSGQLCLDKKKLSTTTLTIGPAAPPPTPSLLQPAPPATASPASDVRVTGGRTREERDAEARRNAIDVDALEEPAPPQAEPAAKRIKLTRCGG